MHSENNEESKERVSESRKEQLKIMSFEKKALPSKRKHKGQSEHFSTCLGVCSHFQHKTQKGFSLLGCVCGTEKWRLAWLFSGVGFHCVCLVVISVVSNS